MVSPASTKVQITHLHQTLQRCIWVIKLLGRRHAEAAQLQQPGSLHDGEKQPGKCHSHSITACSCTGFLHQHNASACDWLNTKHAGFCSDKYSCKVHSGFCTAGSGVCGPYQVCEVEELLIAGLPWLGCCEVCRVQALAVWLSAVEQTMEF